MYRTECMSETITCKIESENLLRNLCWTWTLHSNQDFVKDPARKLTSSCSIPGKRNKRSINPPVLGLVSGCKIAIRWRKRENEPVAIGWREEKGRERKDGWIDIYSSSQISFHLSLSHNQATNETLVCLLYLFEE